MATSVKTCLICHDELKEPRLLPCIHSFCLECLERYCRDKCPGDDVPCPECRNEFVIPKAGVAGLTVRTHDKEAARSEMCEVCSSEQYDIPATVYCVECSQKLCKRCSLPHLKWRRMPHDVIALDAVSPEYHAGGHYCDKHAERVRMYCSDCQTSVCSTCCCELHKTHNFERIETVMQEFARSIDYEIKPVMSRIESFQGAIAHAEGENSKWLSRIQATEQEIKNKGQEVKQYFARLTGILDSQVGDLLHKLTFMKSTAEKEVKSHVDALQLALTELESFKTCSLELQSKSSPSDLMQAASDVRVRAKELLQKHVIPDK